MDILKERRSIRKYKSDPVPKELLEEVIEAGLYAPSGRGLQSAKIIAVTDKEMRDRLSAENARIMGTDKDPFYGAPVVLIVIADKSVPTYVYDGSLVMGNMMNKAFELGLGSCWIHRAKQEFESAIGKDILVKAGICGDYEGIGHVILGYPDEVPVPRPRSEGRVFYI